MKTQQHIRISAKNLGGSSLEDVKQPYRKSGRIKVYIYCRTTNPNPVALKAQKIVCVGYCKREGLAIAKVFSDANVPEFTVGPGLRHLIQACRTDGSNVRHLVLYQTVDSDWVMQVMADALASHKIADGETSLSTRRDRWEVVRW